MERVRKSTYWLIFPVLMIIALVLSLAAAPTQSRYTTVTGWQMTLSQVEETLHCNLLTKQGQKIRLQDMAVGDLREIPLTLTAVGDAENVTVTVESKYLTVDMEQIGSIYNETLKRTLTIGTNEGAMQTVTTPTEASVTVTLTWNGGTLQGEFLVLLLPKETPSDDTGETGESTEESSNGTTENPGEAADPSTEEDTENVPENSENAEETNQTQDENTEIQTVAEDASGDETTTGDDTTGGEDTSADDTPAEDTLTSGEPAAPEVGTWLSGMTNFAADGVLPLLMEVPDGCEEIMLELAMGEDPAEFPAGTRYSTDGGASYTLLYDSYVIAFTPQEGTQKAEVLVDLSAVALDKETVMTVQASAVKEGQVFAVSSIPVQAILEVPAAELKMNPPMLTAEQSIQFIMPLYGDSHTVTVTPFNQEQTEALPSVTLQDGQLTISSDGGAAKPGTYQAVLIWSWRDLEIARQEIVFYVNYTPYVQTEQEAAQSTQAADVA